MRKIIKLIKTVFHGLTSWKLIRIIFVLVLLVFIYRFIYQTTHKSYFADDLVNFDFFLNNFHLTNNTYYLAHDPFFLKIPIYELFTAIFGVTSTKLDLFNIASFSTILLSFALI